MSDVQFLPARRLIDSVPVWDHHACMPLRPKVTSLLPQLARHKAAGFDAVTLNIGFGEKGVDAHLRMLAAQFHWLLAQRDEYLLLSEPDDVGRARATNRLPMGFDIEDANAIGDQLSLIQQYYDLGVRWMLLGYNATNLVGGGCQSDDAGLTAFGRAVVAQMERVGMQVCLSHTGHRTSCDVFEIATQPVIFLHGKCAALDQHPRNIHDDLIRACAQTGGVVGINGASIFLGENDISSQAYARYVDHVVQLVGAEHVSIALDYVFDMGEIEGYFERMKSTSSPGCGYDMRPRFVPPEQLEEIVSVLINWGYRDNDIGLILGGNLLRLARRLERRLETR